VNKTRGVRVLPTSCID